MDHEEVLLDPEEIPFETPPRRFVRTRKIIQRIGRKREKPPSELAIGIFVLAYSFGALGVYYFDTRYLLLAWLMTGPLVVTVYMTYEGRGSLLNPYTLFFAAIIAACVFAYFLYLPKAAFVGEMLQSRLLSS